MPYEPNITDITVHHHRNGISGRGFTAITFTETNPVGEQEYSGRHTAIVPDEDGYKLHDVECFVIHNSKPNLCYRGDNINPAMREIIEAHDIKWREQLTKSGTRQGNEPYIDPGITHFKNMTDVRETIKPTPKPIAVETPKRFAAETSKRFENILSL